MVERWMRQKIGWVEVLFEFGDAAAQHVRSRADVQAGVVVGGFDPVDLGDVEERDCPALLMARRSSLRGVIFASSIFCLARSRARSKRALSNGLRR